MIANIRTAMVTARPAYPVRTIRKLWRAAVDRPYRNVVWLYFVRSAGAFQPFNDTRIDRYPVIFRFVQTALGRDNPVRILSYGCSTGEEVFSLRHYFPRATIKGIDINPANIAVCQRCLRKAPDADISFAVDRSTAAEPSGSYDAIFCMAVLRHNKLGLPHVGMRFETILGVTHGSQTPLFGPDNRLLPDRDYPDTVFRKKLNA
jgi:SAM-dependent methyltransferase